MIRGKIQKWGRKCPGAYLICSVYLMRDIIRFNQLIDSIWYDPQYVETSSFDYIVILKKYFGEVVPDF